jgi:biopolymer transport protein ExbD
MAGSVNLGDSGDDLPISEINVTPFVDVVLVLLVIFMVTAPALVKDVIGVQLPKAASSDEKVMQTLGIAVTAQGQVLVNGVPVEKEGLEAEAKRILAQSPDAQAIISADAEAKHGDVVKAIDWVKGAGISKFALQIEKQ